MFNQNVFLSLGKAQWLRISAAELIMIEAGDSYSTLVTVKGNFLSPLSLKDIEQKLGPDFQRVHRSFIVSVQHIVKLGNETLILTGSREVPISASYRRTLFEGFTFL